MLTHTQFVGNSAATAGGGIAVMSAPALTLRNSSFWGNTAGSGKDVLSPPANAVFNTCSFDNLTSYGTGNSTATASPFTTRAASGEYFFDPANGCADWADAATATTLFNLTGTAWENRTSEISGLVMEGSTAGPAAGVLHHPEDVWIRTFTATANTLSWLTNASAASCTIRNSADGNVVQLGANDLPSGSQGHALASGTVVTLSCHSPRSYAAEATAAVP